MVICTSLWSQVSAKSCEPDKYQHCKLRPGGVHSLDCFGKSNKPHLLCTWKPGDGASKNTYTLTQQQKTRPHCKVHENICEFQHKIKPFKDDNLTVEVFENEDSTKCSKATFTGSPKSLFRCGPPKNVLFTRHSGVLDVQVSWQSEDEKFVTRFGVKYGPPGSYPWDESSVDSQNGNRCRVENLNSSLVYIVQTHCVTNDKCLQCPWSEAYTVPPGDRFISAEMLSFPPNLLYDGYCVTVEKSSGEAHERFTTSHPGIELILSSSAYQINISAFNNASTSPPVSYTIPEGRDMAGSRNGRLNVTVHDNTSFTIYWKHVTKSVCYSVEWKTHGSRVLHTSFHQNNKSYKVISPLPEPLEPYHRYSITLHTRTNKDTCNMKHINNSEHTYGSTQFYYIEGRPISAPTNISYHNMTTNSVVLQWLSIPQEDIRGFLLGYIIHYTEHHQRDTSTENDVILGPLMNNCKLRDLKSGTPYQVQISGFTSAGAGVRSATFLFKTNHEGNLNLRRLITVLAVITTVLIFGPPIIKRIKVVLWPSIPNPGSSNAVQKIDWPCQLELIEEMTNLKVEEWYTKSLQVLERDEVIPASTLPSILPLIRVSELERDSQLTCNWIQSDEDSTAGDTLPNDSTTAFLETPQTDLQRPNFALASDYTTMEMFQQLIPRGMSADRAAIPTTEAEDLTAVKKALDYVRHFSTSETSDSEQTFNVL
ncbi:uncharacterized protein LOC133454437 [Cololabis saira]|uniref:uncharacterized protein LOC133454437 n=1 Tax=Cololabis saira TaxID=129043 RepID=UPI002AD43934|nr:uncharacterized protein LOC133454437 [Cololabis saira]